MCEMCDKFKTCVACEYGGCEEHRAVEELAKPVNDSSVTAGTDRAVDAMKEVKNWFTDNYNDSTKVGIDPADDDGSNLDPNMYPNSDTTGGTTGGSQIRDNMFELLRDTIAAVPQKYWSRLGIGYTTMSGQSFPEACALHGADAPVSLGPQGEPLFRYSEDQPREPNGEFGSGGAATEAKTSENKEEHIASVIKDQVHKMVGDKDPSLINHGNCIVFAKQMEKQIPGAVRVGIPNVALYGKNREQTIAGDAGKPRVTVSIDRPVKADDMPSRIHSYLHQWVQVDGKNYDSETPNGVKNWKDLPYFKKGGAGRENLDIALASMLSKKDRSLANEQQGEPMYRYSEDQPREPNGEFGSGGVAYSSVEKESSLRLWRNGAACRRIQEHVATAIKTGSAPSDSTPDGKAAGILLTEIRNAPIISKDAFRGMGGATGQFDAYKDLQPGARFQLGLGSFSDDENTARDFMGDTFHWDVAGGVKSSMMLSVQGGIKGLDVTAAAGVGGQKEILSMGTFEVISNRGGYTKDNPGELVVRHVGVL